jgi:hypothetical protein
MLASQLDYHKQAAKALGSPPIFKPVKRGKLPRPFNRMGGPRLNATGLLPLGGDYRAIFFYRDAQAFTDSLFLGYLMYVLETGELTPLFEFHWHPSHKGFHCKTPCRDERDFTSRQLAGVRELSMKTQKLDPRNEAHRHELVSIFCRTCGIRLGWQDTKQGKLWR